VAIDVLAFIGEAARPAAVSAGRPAFGVLAVAQEARKRAAEKSNPAGTKNTDVLLYVIFSFLEGVAKSRPYIAQR
jgi:hypothetical protein